MNHHPFKLLLSLSMLPLAASTALATDYLWNGAWSPGNPPGAPDAVFNAGDRFILQAGGPAIAGQITINAGGELQKTNAGNYGFGQHLDVAGTGADGQGAIKTLGGDWLMPQTVRLTGATSMQINGGGWRHQDGANTFNMNGQTLSVTGSGNWYFVNTALQGSGTINVTNFGGEFNFEGGAVLPAEVTLNITNARHSSWDGGGRVMSGNVNMDNAVIETRHNDNNKTYAGNIGITNNATFRTSWSGDGGSPQQNDIIVSGPISGSGTLIKDGNQVGVLHLTNNNNTYNGGTVINVGTISKEAANAIPAGGSISINSAASTLNLNTFNQDIGSGTITGNVIGSGVLRKTGAGTLTLGAGASLTNAGGLELAGGVVKSAGLAGVTGPINVTADTTLQPQVSTAVGLQQWERDNGPPNDAGQFQSGDWGTAGAVLTGVTDGPVGIDIVGNHETFSWIYTGQIINTTNANVGVSFAEQYDDNVKIKIDGNVVLNDGQWNVATNSAVVDLAPGAHTVEFSSYEGGGGEGPNSGWDKGIGIRLGAYTMTDADGDGGGGGTAGSQADSAAFLKINAANLATLGLAFGSFTTGATTDNNAIAISSGATLTVNTSDVATGNYTLGGVISGSGGNLTKTGTGTLTLTGANTYTGITTVSQGTLKLGVGGSLSSSQINVAAGATFDGSAAPVVNIGGGQTLKGNGSVIGNVVVVGTLAPGNSIGQLTITGNLTLSGVSDMELDRNGSPLTADLASVSGTLTYGGTLSLSNIGAPLQPGDTFNLFDAGTTTGSFASINWPSGTVGSDWINNLSLNGTITFVPEAGTSMLSVLGGLFLLRRRRR